jgi:chromosome segregation ATPase
MGIGGTAKKLQKVAEMGEELYKRINDLRAQVAEMRETVNATHDRVDALESEVTEQRAILEALAAHEGIDLDAVVAEAHISEAESDATTTDGVESDGADGVEDDGTEAGSDENPTGATASDENASRE